jgi:Sulfotransferase family
MLAEALGSPHGFVDLGEVAPLKALVPELVDLPQDEAARRLRRALEWTRTLAMVRGLRGVEQTPEVAYVVGPALHAYPRGRVVHLIRDGRDVVCSLLERGWLSPGRGGADDAGLPFGAQARFWVEPERAREFEQASDATRAAWAWRRYVQAARARGERTLELRYEELVADPAAAARTIATHLDAPRELLVAALTHAHDRSVGRYRRDLTPEQLADVEREAGTLLRELGYA